MLIRDRPTDSQALENARSKDLQFAKGTQLAFFTPRLGRKMEVENIEQTAIIFLPLSSYLFFRMRQQQENAVVEKLKSLAQETCE